MFFNFRRFPMKSLNRIPIFGVRQIAVRLYMVADKNGRLSDYFADPQRIYEKWWPYRMLRKKFSPGASPLVSIVVATRDNRPTIERSLRSLMTQTYANLEVIVVDDSSSDGTGDVVRRLQLEDKRIFLLRNDRHLGTGQSRNRAMRVAQGEYITFQDGDDYSFPQRIEMQVQALLSHPNKIMTTCNYARVNDADQRLVINDRRIMECVISMMFRSREVLDKIGYFQNLSVSEDSDYRERIEIAFGRDCCIIVFRTLYHALFRPDSSFFSDVRIVEYDGHRVCYERDSKSADVYAEVLRHHDLMRMGVESVYSSFKAG